MESNIPYIITMFARPKSEGAPTRHDPSPATTESFEAAMARTGDAIADVLYDTTPIFHTVLRHGAEKIKTAVDLAELQNELEQEFPGGAIVNITVIGEVSVRPFPAVGDWAFFIEMPGDTRLARRRGFAIRNISRVAEGGISDAGQLLTALRGHIGTGSDYEFAAEDVQILCVIPLPLVVQSE